MFAGGTTDSGGSGGGGGVSGIHGLLLPPLLQPFFSQFRGITSDHHHYNQIPQIHQ